MAAMEDMTSVTVSPRISFSHDLSQSDLSPAAVGIGRMDASLPLDASIDFNFSLATDATSFDSSIADDVFSDGKLLPVPIKEKASSTAPMPAAAAPTAPPKERAPRPPPDPPMQLTRKRGSLREVMARMDHDVDVGERRCSPAQQKPSSFWRFGRSSSLNYRGKRTGSLCPFLLLRSKSTGSAPTPNPTRSRRPCNVHSMSSSSLPLSFQKAPCEPSARRYYYSGSSGKSYGNGVRIGPILNMPVPAASGLNVFSYLLCSCGDKSTRRGSAIA